MSPNNSGVRCGKLWRRDISLGVQTDGAHDSRPMCAREITQAMRNDRGRHWHIAAAVQLPNFLAGREVITAGVMPAVDQDSGLVAVADYGRRAPGWNIRARCSPNFFSIFQIEE